MEVMGLHLPGSSFVNPGTPMRAALTAEAGRQVTGLTAIGDDYTPVGEMIDERAIVNGSVALLATGGSTNHTMHLVAIAQAAGITLTWNDISELSAVVPLLARIYPNGSADVNHFHAAGGLGFTIASLLDAGLLHEDVQTVVGRGLRRYTQEPKLDGDGVMWLDGTTMSHDTSVLRGVEDPFDTDGGLKTLAAISVRASSRPRPSNPNTARSPHPPSSSTTRPTSWPRSRPASWTAIWSRYCAIRVPARSGCPSCTS